MTKPYATKLKSKVKRYKAFLPDSFMASNNLSFNRLVSLVLVGTSFMITGGSIVEITAKPDNNLSLGFFLIGMIILLYTYIRFLFPNLFQKVRKILSS